MRTIETLIMRVKCDLPITQEEADRLNKHLDEVIAKQNRYANFWMAVAFGSLFIAAIVGIFG